MSGFGSAVAELGDSFGRIGAASVTAVAWGTLLWQLEREAALKVAVVLVASVFMGFLVLPGSKKDKWPAVEEPPSVDPLAAYPEYDLLDPKKSFMQVGELLVAETVAELPGKYEVAESECEWIEKMLKYNVMGGKMNRGLMVVETGKLLLAGRGEKATSAQLTQFAVLGWCVEWLQAWLLVADDFMDASITRRGQPCWYKCPGVEKIAINDAFLIETLTYKVLRRHFGEANPSIYAQLVDLLQESTLQTELGQLLDLRCEHVTLQEFTLSRWEKIVKYKTSYYSFYLPVAMAMILTGITDRKAFDAAREILTIMGIYFQAQDDYLDAFGSPEQIGKIGTDIQDKKCGWLFVHAYHELCDKSQRNYLDKHYGKCQVGSQAEQNIKKSYVDVGLPELYSAYEQASYDSIMNLKYKILDCQLPWSVFDAFLKKIYKREK